MLPKSREGNPVLGEVGSQIPLALGLVGLCRLFVSAFPVTPLRNVAFGWVEVGDGLLLVDPDQGLVDWVVRDDLAFGSPELDVVQVGLSLLEVGEGDGIAVNPDVPSVCDILELMYSNLGHRLESASVVKAMRRLHAETFWLTWGNSHISTYGI